MIAPTLAFQTAVRATLIAAPAVTALVPAERIRAGGLRPDLMPAILLAEAQAEFLGCAAGSQRLARVSLTLHVWAQEDGADTARQIGGAVVHALEFGPADTAEIAVDEWERLSMVWMRDPQPEINNTHGVIMLEAVVRWRV